MFPNFWGAAPSLIFREVSFWGVFEWEPFFVHINMVILKDFPYNCVAIVWWLFQRFFYIYPMGEMIQFDEHILQMGW